MSLFASSWGVLRGERLAGCELVDLVRWRRPRPGDQVAAGRAPGRGAVLELELSRGAPLARGERLAGAELVDLVC
ncbi:hypothetical protein [Burkholderia gladioli]|uniref:hypothetical protein n=1 Tax=Burkholderia gladioli TaxID=28095 RepID=UPI00163F9400|nr:hypothetical protein [Burkholderia gladioli]